MKNHRMIKSWDTIQISNPTKEKIWQKVMERSEETVRNKHGKKLLIPALGFAICMIIMIGIMIPGHVRKNEKGGEIVQEGIEKIQINPLGDFAQVSIDADIDYFNTTKKINADVISFNGAKEEIGDMFVPRDLNIPNYYVLYTRKDAKSDYDILHDCVLSYHDEADERSIKIAMTKLEQPLRDYFLDVKNLKESIINNVSITILNHTTMYIVTFQINEIRYDIETMRLSEEEMIQLLKSITQKPLDNVFRYVEQLEHTPKKHIPYEIGEPNYE